MNPGRFFARFAKAGFRFGRFAEAQIERYREATPAETLAMFRRLQHSTSAPPGPKTSWLGEVIVHSEDIRRPLGIDHEYPPRAVRQVIDFYCGSNALIGTKTRIADLTLRATDQDWTHGSGPLVEGRLIDLLMAATGRAQACDRLGGDGVTTLRLRCGELPEAEPDRLEGSRNTAPGPRSATSSPGLFSAHVRRLRHPQPMQESSRSRSRSSRSIWASSRGRHDRESRDQSALVGAWSSGSVRQRLGDLVEGEPDALGRSHESDPAQRGLRVAPLVAGGPLRGIRPRSS